MKPSLISCVFMTALLLDTAACSCEKETVIKEVVPDCSATQPRGACEAGEACFEGACVAADSLCSPSNLTGTCTSGKVCFGGGCVLESALCSAGNSTGPCEIGETCFEGACVETSSLCSTTNPIGVCPSGQTCQEGICAGAIADAEECDTPVYTTQPTIEAHTAETVKEVLEVEGLQFKDLNDNDELDPYEDWRLLEICRAKDLVSQMTMEQKIGVMSEGPAFGWGGLSPDGSVDESTASKIVDDHVRYGLMRIGGNNSGSGYARYFNNVQQLCEAQPLGIPFTIIADPIHGFGMSTNSGEQSLDVNGTVSDWPYPLGLGAINDTELTRQFGDIVRSEFMAMGVRWQFGPMADLATEPRWARVQNTFGANTYHVTHHVRAFISGLQAVGDGGLKNGIAATVKHFPGAGPNEDGMDSHSYPGRFNVFPGDNFMNHLIPFQAAIDVGVAAVMPCYSIYLNQRDYDPQQVGAAFSYELITVQLKQRMGFDGVVTADWGALSDGYNTESLSLSQRAAMFLEAGSHQLGMDSESNFKDAYDQGYITEAQIDEAVEKILEMTFKVGAFENPYVDPTEAAAVVKSKEHRTAGFEAQKKAIVLLANRAHEFEPAPTAPIGTAAPPDPAPKYLPIDGSRYEDVNENGAPDGGEYICDTDGDGTVEIYFDGVVDSLVADPENPDGVTDILGEYDYTSAGDDSALPIAEAEGLDDADIVIIRITARKGEYFGLDAGIPLSFDGPFPGDDTDETIKPAIVDRNKVIDALRARDGYTDSTGTKVDATNPDLRIVLVMHMDRPGIVEPFIKGLSTLDEKSGEPGSYPLVSDVSNHDPDGLSGVDAFLVEFGAYDRAVLDFLFNVNPIDDWDFGTGRLPMELPSSDEEVQKQYEDVPADTPNPTFMLGSGMTY